MNKIETTVDSVKNDIKAFYKHNMHHFMVMNAVDLGGKIELQWFFCDYAFPSAVTTFYAYISPEMEVPDISDIVPSAWVAQAELSDLMDISIENTKKGFVLEPDFESGPLRKKNSNGKTI